MTRVTLIFVLLLVSLQSCHRKYPNVFTTIKADSVIAYKYDGEGDVEIVDEKGRLAKLIEASVRLDRTQIDKIGGVLCDGASYGGDIAACFDPHLGLVFYRKGKPAEYVSICLECNYLISSMKMPVSGGFSVKGANGIVRFEKEIGFRK